MGRSIIAIGGPHGSGKSSVAKRLAEELNMNYISAGIVFRQIAKERNVSLQELSELVIKEPEIDRQIDDRTREQSDNANTIVDAQLAPHFTPLDTTLKISIMASKTIRWKRIANREGVDLDSAKKETEIREESERNRFLDLYGIDINDHSFYDIIVNTDRLNEERTYEICLAIVKKALESE